MIAVSRARLLPFAAVLAAACGDLGEDPRVNLTVSAHVSPAGACPTRPGTPSNCISQTIAALTFEETAGVEAVIGDVHVSACRGASCREMRLSTRTGEPGDVVPARGTLVHLYFDPVFHGERDPPDTVTATALVLTPSRSVPLAGEFRFTPSIRPGAD